MAPPDFSDLQWVDYIAKAYKEALNKQWERWRLGKPALLSTGEVEFQAIHINLEKFSKGLQELKKRFPKPKQDSRPGSKEEADFREWDKKLQDFYFARVHSLKEKDKDPGQTALCLSGGGIRSAAFALGLMQGLARRGLRGSASRCEPGV
jgi:hypothetical protein